jgi:hypothetical protein
MKPIPPLLLICEGRRPRLRMAPAPAVREISIHRDVERLLRDHGADGWWWFHAANGEARDPRAAAKLKAMGVKPGVPDLTLISPAGVAHFLEVKRPGGRLSEPQEAFAAWAAGHGVPFSAADSLSHARAILTRWGALKDIQNG